MSDDPLPFLDPTHSALMRAVMREVSEESANKAVEKYGRTQRSSCDAHLVRTANLEAVTFGKAETGIHGLDERMTAAEAQAKATEAAMEAWDEDRKSLRRSVRTAIFAIVGSLIVNLTMLGVTLLVS
jgi:hypothetical protein